MSTDVFEMISRSIPDEPSLQLEISAYCDPMQHVECESMIRSFKDSHPSVYVMIATEGIMLNDNRMKALLHSGVSHISYSLNAATSERYEWLCGRDLYPRARSNLLRLIELREQMPGRGPIITTHIIGVKENEHDFEEFVTFWQQYLPDGVSIRTFGNWGGLVDGLVTPLDNWSHIDWNNRYPCLNPFSAIKIMSNGDYYACYLDAYSRQPRFGNIMEVDIATIWHTAYKEHREKKHLAGDFQTRLCGKCMVWALFPNLFERVGEKGFRLKQH